MSELKDGLNKLRENFVAGDKDESLFEIRMMALEMLQEIIAKLEKVADSMDGISKAIADK